MTTKHLLFVDGKPREHNELDFRINYPQVNVTSFRDTTPRYIQGPPDYVIHIDGERLWNYNEVIHNDNGDIWVWVDKTSPQRRQARIKAAADQAERKAHFQANAVFFQANAVFCDRCDAMRLPHDDHWDEDCNCELCR